MLAESARFAWNLENIWGRADRESTPYAPQALRLLLNEFGRVNGYGKLRSAHT